MSKSQKGLNSITDKKLPRERPWGSVRNVVIEPKGKEQVSVRLLKVQLRRLNALVVGFDTSFNAVVREAINRGLPILERELEEKKDTTSQP